MGKEVVVCGWRNCDIELTDGHYCTPSHKNKARVARNKKPSTSAQVKEHVWNSSGWSFAKLMQRATGLAEEHKADPERVQELMLQAMKKRIDYRLAELELLKLGDLHE